MQQQNTRADEVSVDPIHHTRKMAERLSALIVHMRDDIEHVDEPQFKAIFETAAEVMTGLVTALRHYEQKSEPAWNKESTR